MSVRGIGLTELAVGLAIAAWAAWSVRRTGAARLPAAVRFILVAALVAALSTPIAGPPEGRRVVHLVDRSDSIARATGGPGEAGDGAGADPEAEAEVGPGAIAGSGGAADERSGTRRPLEIGFGDDASSDLARALDLGGRVAGDGGRIVLASDGHATRDEGEGAGGGASGGGGAGHAVLKAAELAARGVRIDVVALPSRFDEPGDVAIAGLDAPEVVRVGDPFSILVGLRGTAPAAGELIVRMDGGPALRQPFDLDAFEQTIGIALPAPEDTGFALIEVEVDTPGDDRPDNDRAMLHVGVAPAPSVLVVGEGAAVVTAAGILEADGLTTTIAGPARAPIRAEELARFDALVLVDTPARALALDQRAAIESAVEAHGVGLVLSGGRQSFALGDWRGTALERLSPLSMEPAPRTSREPVTLVLLLDRSASMGGGDGRVTKLDLAREAVLLAAEALEPHDRIGVAAYADSAAWLIEPREVGAGLALAELQAELSGVMPAGGTRILGALELGLGALGREPGQIRHAVLLSDGRDLESDTAASRQAVAGGAEAGLTLSTIALGVDADPDFLSDLARLGRGRYHAALEPSDLPRLLLDEGEIVGGQVERRSVTRIVHAASAPDLDFQSIDLDAVPEFGGYLALEPRPAPGARRIFDSAEGDPILVAGQRGLGRVMAWTSDFGDDWTAAWSQSPAAIALFGRTARAASAPPLPPASLRTAPTASGLAVEVDITHLPSADPRLGARLVITASTGITRSIDLRPGSIGVLAAEVELAAGTSAVGRIEVGEGRSGSDAADEGSTLRWPVVLRRDPNPELLPQPDPGGLLAAIARAGGGDVLHGSGGPADMPIAGQASSRALWPFLAGLAAVLWPLDVALRLRSGGRGASGRGGGDETRLEQRSATPAARAPIATRGEEER